MKVGDNSLRALKAFFRKELISMYGQGETDSLLKLAVAHVLGLPYGQLRDEIRLSESDLLVFFDLVKRLKKNEPLQYILGKADFCGYVFKVTPAVLIPRPETEELVHWVINDYQNRQPSRIVDLCSGSGCIAIVLKKHFFQAVTEGIELSSEAIAVAQENARQLGAEVRFYQADVLELTPAALGTVDVLTANPPYIGRAEAGSLAPNVLDHEPHMALFVEGEDVLLFYRKIAGLAAAALSPGGRVHVEINHQYGNEVKGIFEEAGLKQVVLRTDISGKARMVSATKE